MDVPLWKRKCTNYIDAPSELIWTHGAKSSAFYVRILVTVWVMSLMNPCHILWKIWNDHLLEKFVSKSKYKAGDFAFYLERYAFFVWQEFFECSSHKLALTKISQFWWYQNQSFKESNNFLLFLFIVAPKSWVKRGR